MQKKFNPMRVMLLSLALLFSFSVFAQDRTVTGKVTSAEDNEPLPFVNVSIKGTTQGTTTDTDGNYSIEVSGPDAVLSFSFLGFTTQERRVGNASIINIALEFDSRELDELVVVGYGMQRKVDITGSVASVTREDFNAGQVTTAEQLVTGKVAGVQITPNNGRPGAGARIRIRGGSSLNASNDPLIVIDGVPIDNSGTAGTSNPLNFLNPNDIETFDILKDASATAIYGSRASNGVILITTTKGKAGQGLKVDAGYRGSLAQITRTVDMLSADEIRAAALTNANASQQALIGDATTNWQDQVYQQAFTHDANVTVSGSIGDFLPIRVSAGYLSQDGILKTDKLERMSGSLNLSPSFFNDDLKVNLNLKAVGTTSQFASGAALGNAITFDPTQPVFSENGINGYYEWLVGSNPNNIAPRNPVGLLDQRDDRGDVFRSIGNIQFNYALPFVEGLSANLNLGYDVSQSEGRVIIPATAAESFLVGGSFSRYEQNKRNLLADFYFNYVKDLGNAGSIDVTAGYSAQDFRIDNPTFAVFNAEGTEISPATRATRPQYRLISYFGRVNYNFSDKYLITATVRTDGSSRFAEDNRWGVFPSVAGAWRISEEGFLKGNTTVTDLKLRVGYGVTGQQDIGATLPFLPRYTPSDEAAQYQFGGQFFPTLRPEGYDSNIKWEETETYNAGLDFEFASGKFYGSVDYYFKRTNDLLSVIPVPAGTNLTNRLFTNVGNIENEGIEVALNVNLVNTADLKWDIGANFTYNKNTITSLSNVQDDSEGILVGGISGGTGNTVQIQSVGFAPNTFYLFEQVYNTDGTPIEGAYVDQNGDGVINSEDLVRQQFPDAPYFFGFTNQTSYKKWNLSFTLRGSLDNYVYNNVRSANGSFQNLNLPGYIFNMTRDVLDSNFENYQFFSDYYLENASFIRMDNISLSYNYGEISNSGVRMTLSAAVQNAFVITNYSGIDPEVPGGIDNNFYPNPRVFSLGVNFGF